MRPAVRQRVHQHPALGRLLLTLGGLRMAKAALVAQEYLHRAREGRIA